MVHEGWRDGCLGDLVRLQRGYDLPAPDRKEGGIQVIGGGGPNGFHDVARAPAPGIVIGRSGSGIGNAWWSDKPFWPLNTGMYVIDYLGNDPKFCFCWLDWIDFRSHNSGGAQPSLNRNFIYPIPIPIPPLPEQKKIAEILSTWDKAIETTRKLLTNAETQKRGLMQQLLNGKRRIKGFNEVWKERELGQILNIEYGKSPNGIASESGKYPIIGTGGETGKTDTWLVNGPAIVIGRKGTIDKPRLIEGPFWPIDTTFACKVKPGFAIRWAYRAVQHIGLRRYNEASGVPSLSRETLRSIRMVIPGRDEQCKIAEVIDAADDQCQSLEHQVTKFVAEKRALMQQLLTGKRRVKTDGNSI